jgi:pSer/pThr/pTyr-binding forkhead associated (FHA) protein/tetratricopeptide (TPR) repeat protein
MARLILKLHGEQVTSLTLESGMEYIAGRAQDAQLPMDNGRGISRHHLKFYERDGIWVGESLSKFVPIQKGSETMEVIELSEPTVFSVPPYDFHFEPTVEGAGAEMPEDHAGNLPAFYQPRVNPVAGSGAPGDADPEGTSPRANNEATVAGLANLVPYFRISYPNTADDEVLKLEGHLWVAGRDHGCEIAIDSPHISRKHFELARTKEGFYITDLGSSNGTHLNGQRLPPHEPTQISSGDEVRVMNIEMTFEIRDLQFANRVDRLPVPAFDPLMDPRMGGFPVPWTGGGPEQFEATQYRAPEGVELSLKNWRQLRLSDLKRVDWRKNKVRVALLVLIPLLFIMILVPGKPSVKPAPRGPAGSASFEHLTNEQKLTVKDSFNLARNLYVQGKYALCLTELAKLHEVIPQYENSKELQSFCEQGLELVRRQEDLERKEREKAMIESQINGYVESCKNKLKADATVDETRQCLAPAMELSPEHPAVVEMLHGAQIHEEERKFMAQQKAEREAKIASAVAHFNRAIATYKKGDLLKSVHDLEKFVGTSYPASGELKEKARRQIASIKKEIKVKVDAYLEECKAMAAKNRYKDAYLSCDKAVDQDPGNGEAKETRSRMLQELRRQMKTIYQDSVLEESLGNVDSAKEKWKKIIQEDLSFDDYTTKAKLKLQKYGAGL